jgi:hypothetical protein
VLLLLTFGRHGLLFGHCWLTFSAAFPTVAVQLTLPLVRLR